MQTKLWIILSISLLLLAATACQVPADSELIEGILRNVDGLDGEMTITTKDGETITIKITKDTPVATDNGSTKVDKVEVGSVVKVETDKRDIITRKADPLSTVETKPTTASFAASRILPSLGSFEDVFKVLGVWEKAAILREKGLAWGQVARELGYGEDKMHIQLQTIAKEYLTKALNSGLITKEQYELEFQRFNELALKWIKTIFSDVDVKPMPVTTSNVGASHILPSLGSFEDVFKVLGVWEKAAILREKGLAWGQAAKELGYGEDKMHLQLQTIAKEYLTKALNSGLVTREQYELEFQRFNELALKWIKAIFSDTGVKPTTTTDSLSGK